MPADRHDAELIVQIAQWGSMSGVFDLTPTLFADDFDPDQASTEDEPVRKLLQWGELIGTFTKHGLLDRELVLDWLWVEGLWERVAPAVSKEREKLGAPELYENFEALAQARPRE